MKFLKRAFKDALLTKGGVEAVVRCPECGRPGKNKLCIRLDNYFYHCWVCSLKGRSIGWLLKKYAPNFLDEYIKNFEDDKFNFNSLETSEPEIYVELPQDFCLLTQSSSPNAKAIKKYLYSRGLNNNHLWRYRIGFSNENEWKRRAIIPSFDEDGKLNYFTGRAIDNTSFIKYLNVKVPRNSLIFNEIDLNWKKPIILVEGPMDLIKCPQNSTCLLGSYLSINYKLFEKLAINKTPVYLLMDKDAEEKAHKIAKLLVQYNVMVKMNFVLSGDIGDLNNNQVCKIVEESHSWSSSSALKSKIRNMRSGSIL